MWSLSDLLPSEAQDEPAAHDESILAPAVAFKRSPIRVEGTSVDFYGDTQLDMSEINLRYDSARGIQEWVVGYPRTRAAAWKQPGHLLFRL